MNLYQSQTLNNEKKKPRKEIISVLKKDKPAFGVIAATSVYLHEAFSYPNTYLIPCH